MVAAFALASAISAQTASAAGKSNPNAILNGTYAGAGTSLEWITPIVGSPYKIDAAFAAVRNFDGRGNFSGTYTLTFAGTFSAAPPTTCVYSVTGTYNLNGDGSGTLSAT